MTGDISIHVSLGIKDLSCRDKDKKEHGFDICSVYHSQPRKRDRYQSSWDSIFFFSQIHWLNTINLSVHKVQGDFFFKQLNVFKWQYRYTHEEKE